MYFLYIIKSKIDNRHYTGITDNLKRRLAEHNQGKKSTPSTNKRGPFELAYLEECKNRLEARTREKFWKSGEGRELRNLITKQSL